eukprot:COSAG03_NODE_2117_length_3105_cov_5.987359_2_plen_113_part_00
MQCPGRESLLPPCSSQTQSNVSKLSPHGRTTAGGRRRGLDIAGSFADRWPERATLMLIGAGFVASRCLLQAPHREHTRSTAHPDTEHKAHRETRTHIGRERERESGVTGCTL